MSSTKMAMFYSNENFPIPTAQALRALGHDVVTIQERGKANESTTDLEVLALAKAEGRILLTLNRKDFYRLHSQDSDHPEIIVCVAEQDFQRLAERIHETVNSVENLHGTLIRVPSRN